MSDSGNVKLRNPHCRRNSLILTDTNIVTTRFTRVGNEILKPLNHFSVENLIKKMYCVIPTILIF